jgi:hypothetical protein
VFCGVYTEFGATLKQFLRGSPGATQGRAAPEDQHLAISRRAAEIKEKKHRTILAANANTNAGTPTTITRFDIYRGDRASHATHSERSSALHKTTRKAPHRES